MKPAALILVGLAAAAAIVGVMSLGGGSAKGSGGTGGNGGTNADLTTNWGKVPMQWRQYFLELEKAAAVPGSARLFAILGWRATRWDQSVHMAGTQVMVSNETYMALKNLRPPLAQAAKAAAWGVGGFYLMSAPEMLWSGWKQIWANAPLLASDPDVMLNVNLASFAAITRLHDIQSIMAPQDGRLEYAAAMIDPDLFAKEKGGVLIGSYKTQFQQSATDLGIDISKLPTKFAPSAGWPGVLPTYETVSKLPYPKPVDLGKLAA